MPKRKETPDVMDELLGMKGVPGTPDTLGVPRTPAPTSTPIPASTPSEWVKKTYLIKRKHIEKIKAEAYWRRLQLREIVDEAFEAYFADNDIKPKPDR